MWLLWTSVAVAGEIEVQTHTPMVITIDGKIVEYLDGQAVVRATDLAGGSHTVAVRNLLGKTIATETVEVAVDEQVRMQYKAKTLTTTGSGPLPQASGAPAASEPAGEPMDGPTFAAVCERIRGEANDLVRKRQIEATAEANWFSTGQVVTLLRFIDNESTKGLAAKAFVGRVTDPQNAEIIASAFDNAATGRMAVSRF